MNYSNISFLLNTLDKLNPKFPEIGAGMYNHIISLIEPARDEFNCVGLNLYNINALITNLESLNPLTNEIGRGKFNNIISLIQPAKLELEQITG